MEKSQMKNIVILKNLPSNLIEEAFVILKSRKTAKRLEYIEKNDKVQKKANSKAPKDYIISEAENVICNYINNTQKKQPKNNCYKSNKVYKGLKIYSAITTVLLIISLIIII